MNLDTFLDTMSKLTKEVANTESNVEAYLCRLQALRLWIAQYGTAEE